MPRTHHQSAGDVISTLCFLGMSIWLGSEAIITQSKINQIGLTICSIACFAAGFRYAIGKAVIALRTVKDNRTQNTKEKNNKT